MKLPFIVALTSCACLSFSDAFSATVIEDAHVDLNISYDTPTKFTISPRNDDEGIEYADSRAVMIGGPGTKRTRTGSEIGDFSFLGVNIGENYWRLPQNQAVGLIYMGLASYGVSSGEIDAYDATAESNGRVTGVGTWARMRLIQVSGPGLFSVWASGSSGPKVFMATSDGIQASDTLWSLAGGHAHYNWGFTKVGCYDIQVRGLGYENDGTANLGNLITGRLLCLHVGIETYPAVVDGQVQLGGWLGDLESKSVNIKLYQGGVLKQDKNQYLMKKDGLTTDPSLGRFAFSFSERGNSDVVVKPTGYLSRKFSVTLGETLDAGQVATTFYDFPGSQPIQAQFIAGDCDNNDIINTDDYLVLSNAFDTSVGDPTFDSRADIDGTGTVTTDDYLILSENFDLSGEA